MLKIELDLKSKTKEEVISELASLTGISNQSIIDALIVRESKGSTGIGNNVAVPHVQHNDVSEFTYVIGISKAGIDFNAMDGKPVYVFFLHLSPKKYSHLSNLARISKLARSEDLILKMRSGTMEEVQRIWDLNENS